MQLKLDHTAFEKEIEERGIEYLIHFTPTINLMGIFELGKLLSRALLEKCDIDQTDIRDYVEFTDDIRFDDKNYINLSIQHPNSFLFNRFREKTANESHIYWCVLKIDKKYIYHQDTLFSVTNAANGYNKRNVGVTGDIDKFRMMFTPSLTVVTSYNSKIIYSPIFHHNKQDNATFLHRNYLLQLPMNDYVESYLTVQYLETILHDHTCSLASLKHLSQFSSNKQFQ